MISFPSVSVVTAEASEEADWLSDALLVFSADEVPVVLVSD
jgi:hypothetical protein